MEIIQDQLEILAEEKNNKIIVEVEENVMDSSLIMIDLFKFSLILQKTVFNLRKMATITLRGKAGNKETIIEIEDTGIGIDPEEVENIWRQVL